MRDQRWLERMWCARAVDVQAAPPGWREWARLALLDGSGLAFADRLGWPTSAPPMTDPGWDRLRDPALREALGQVFTPGHIADLVARLALGGPLPNDDVLDPACGDGSLLLAVCRARRASGWSVARCLAHVEGWDLDPDAAWLCRARLVGWALAEGGDDVPGSLRVVGGVDALAEAGPPGDLLARRRPYLRGFGAVVSNPPYLEAKRFRRVDPTLRDRLRAAFPQLAGSFDLYTAFCWRALDQVEPDGSIVWVLPNKVTQGRYASALRARLVDSEDASVCHLVDLAGMKPRPFPGTQVYPVVLHVRRGPGDAFRAHRVRASTDLDTPPASWRAVPVAAVRAAGRERPLFVPFDTWPHLEPLFARPRLGEVATVASTCSFHVRGLRERFVTASRPEHDGVPYLGLDSYARRLEVGLFRVAWSGGWLRYDDAALRRAGNPLPPLELFQRPKAILCQHGRRMRVALDAEGRFATKDVYPVAFPIHPDWTLERLVAVLGSTVFTALYNTVWHGIVCGGDTYHYLPSFLREVPVPDAGDLVGADDLVGRLCAGDGPVDGAAWLALDRLVTAAYGVDEAGRARLADVHLLRVGEAAPG